MNKRETIENLCHYFLSQDHELESLMEDVKFNEFETKKQKMEFIKNSLYYAVSSLYIGKKETNKRIKEALND